MPVYILSMDSGRRATITATDDEAARTEALRVLKPGERGKLLREIGQVGKLAQPILKGPQRPYCAKCDCFVGGR